MGTAEELLTLLLLSKKGNKLPEISSLSNNDYVIVYDTDTELLSRILKTNLTTGTQGGISNKLNLVVDNNGQDQFSIQTKPDNIDLKINRVFQVQGIDYNYNNQTGILDIINSNVANSIKTTSLIDLRSFSNSSSKKEILPITAVGQDEFYLLDIPNNIELLINRTPLIEATDYTYNQSSGLLTIVNQSFVNQITLNTSLEVRKFF